MKQAIILISTIILGLAIAGLITAFYSPVKDKADGATDKLQKMEIVVSYEQDGGKNEAVYNPYC